VLGEIGAEMSPDDRIYSLVLTWVCVVAAVVFASVAFRGIGKRPWTDQTKRAILGAVGLAVLAAWFTVLHLN
jgi:hypothetical protein